jgi:low affinity Fe/Cu permease
MSDTLTILEKLNGFYSGAMLQLVAYTAALLALVGIIVPVAISVIVSLAQRRQFKNEEAALNAKLSEAIRSARSDLEAVIKASLVTLEAKLDEKLAGMRTDIDEEITKASAQTLARTHSLPAGASHRKALCISLSCWGFRVRCD